MRSRRPQTALASLLLLFVASAGVCKSSAQTQAEEEAARGLSVEDFYCPDDQLRGLVTRLLENNPQVLSVWARSTSSFQRVAQERSLPDPQLLYRYYVEPPETRVGPQNHALEISQALPWKGKLDLQARRAESMATGATWEAEETERTLVARLKRAYFEAAYLQEALRVNEEELELLGRFESIALRRYSTGGGIQQSVVRVQTDISRLDERGYALRERLGAVERGISELIGAPAVPLTLGEVALILPDVTYDRNRLEQAAVSGHPRVRALEQRIEADRLWATRRKLDRRPDFRVGVGYTLVEDREDLAGRVNPPQGNGQDVLAATVGLNIPVFRKRIRAGVAEARESERANEQALESARNRLRFEIQEALLRIESLSERGRLFREVIVPQAEESLASAEAAYTTDRLGFLDLLEAERILFQSRLAYHRLVSDLWIALTDLELSVAEAFPPPSPTAGGTEGGSPS